MITIKTWDELLKIGTESIIKELPPDPIQIDQNLTLKIRVCGPSWDDYIDYRGASYIQELQKSVNRLYREVADPDVPLREISKYITVKVRVTNGSQWFQIKFDKALERMLNKLDGKQTTFIVALSIFCIGGYMTTGKILDYKKQLQMNAQQLEHAEKQGETALKVAEKLVPLIDKTLQIIDQKDLEKAPRTLVSKLKGEDTILFPGSDTELTAIKAKHRYPRKPKSKNEAGIFDDVYKIISIDFDKTPTEFVIDKNGFQFRAAAKLAGDDIEKLSEKFKDALRSGEDLKTPLQTFIVYNKRGIKAASITGIGEKRNDTQNINDLIKLR